jgi:hypothetical protein
MSCANKFSVTPAQFDAGAKELKLTGDKGSATNSGIDFDYSYDRINSNLFVTVTHKPFIIPCSAIFSKITDALTK